MDDRRSVQKLVLLRRYRNPTGGGGGGGQDAHITTTQTNPVVPQQLGPLANMLKMISTGLTGSPVNFGGIPGLDATGGGGPLIPNPSLGDMFASMPFMAGYNRSGINAGNAGATGGNYPSTRPTNRLPPSWSNAGGGIDMGGGAANPGGVNPIGPPDVGGGPALAGRMLPRPGSTVPNSNITPGLASGGGTIMPRRLPPIYTASGSVPGGGSIGNIFAGTTPRML